ncbi:sulfatase-like hydrolase/transferase [Puniceicoccaceae bacterium K14]|nr:sulfatase-like hydrolase/transferase [Puniceicoccaceae bacterium K14]
MKRYNLFVLLILLKAVALAGTGLSKYPNILFILVDDLGYGDVNFELNSVDAFNNPNLKTPNLARLAKQSRVFTQHYAASPICSPSRAGLLTGRTPTRTNINLFIRDKLDNETSFLHGRELTVPEMLKSRGYETAIFGKWHLNGADWENRDSWTGWTGSYPKQQGFDFGFVSKENPHYTRMLAENTQKNPGDFFNVDGEPLGAVKGYTSDILSSAAIDWLENRRDLETPFFAFLSYDAVHLRVDAADRYQDLYETGDARKDAYYANITHVDAAIGRVLNALEKNGFDENTIVFFSSDNGPPALNTWHATYFCYGTSYPLIGGKSQLSEGGIRVPGMVRWTGKIKPGVSHEPNSTLDLLPTLAELVEATLPDDRIIDGESILEHLFDCNTRVDRLHPIYWQFEYHKETAKVEGTEYERRKVGWPPRQKVLLPHVKIRKGDYVLYGLASEKFVKPTEFRLYNIVGDREERIELGKKHPDVLTAMRNEMMTFYASVEADRLATSALIAKGAKP